MNPFCATSSVIGNAERRRRADLLCLSITTGVWRTRYAKCDWESYLADRRATCRAESR